MGAGLCGEEENFRRTYYRDPLRRISDATLLESEAGHSYPDSTLKNYIEILKEMKDREHSQAVLALLPKVQARGNCIDCRGSLEVLDDFGDPRAPVNVREKWDSEGCTYINEGWRCYWCDQLKNQKPISTRKSGPTGLPIPVVILSLFLILGLMVFTVFMNLNG